MLDGDAMAMVVPRSAAPTGLPSALVRLPEPQPENVSETDAADASGEVSAGSGTDSDGVVPPVIVAGVKLNEFDARAGAGITASVPETATEAVLLGALEAVS